MTDTSEFSLVFVSSDNFLYSEVSRRCPDKVPQSDTLKSYFKISLSSSPSDSLSDSALLKELWLWTTRPQW